MRNYIQYWFGITEYETAAHDPLAPIYDIEGSPDELQLEFDLLKESLINNGFNVLSQSVLGTRYFKLDKATLGTLLGGFNTSYLWELPDATNQTTITPRHDPAWPSNDGPKRTVTPSQITGLFIVVRNGLYFAGFEAGTGDPVFVRFLFGLTSAHLYVTSAQATTDAGRIRKFYKRPDIPVEVVEI